MLPAGVIGDRLGRRRTLLAGMALFGAASAACALAGSVGELVAARAAMGVGAAAIMPLAIAYVPAAFAPAERPKAISLRHRGGRGRAAAGADRGRRAAALVRVELGVLGQRAADRGRAGGRGRAAARVAARCRAARGLAGHAAGRDERRGARLRGRARARARLAGARHARAAGACRRRGRRVHRLGAPRPGSARRPGTAPQPPLRVGHGRRRSRLVRPLRSALRAAAVPAERARPRRPRDGRPSDPADGRADPGRRAGEPAATGARDARRGQRRARAAWPARWYGSPRSRRARPTR